MQKKATLKKWLSCFTKNYVILLYEKKINNS